MRDARPGDLRVALHQVGYEQKAYWRNPMAAVFTFAFPIIFLIVVGTSAGSSQVPGYSLRYDQYVVVAMLTFGLIAACYTNLAMAICTRRETGVLKRMRGTPIAIGSYMGGLIGSVLIVVALLTVLVVAIGMAFYHLHFPFHPGAVLVTLLVGIVTFCALGLAVTILVPNADAAPAIVNGIYFPIVFISGVFYPLSQGSVLARIADWFPIFHMIRALVSAFEGGPGSGLRVGDLVAMLAWAVAALFITARRFRWEPRRPKA
jgi:ABC-2 type transport system permease protein